MFGSSDPDNPMGGLLGDLMKVIGSGPGAGGQLVRGRPHPGLRRGHRRRGGREPRPAGAHRLRGAGPGGRAARGRGHGDRPRLGGRRRLLRGGRAGAVELPGPRGLPARPQVDGGSAAAGGGGRPVVVGPERARPRRGRRPRRAARAVRHHARPGLPRHAVRLGRRAPGPPRLRPVRPPAALARVVDAAARPGQRGALRRGLEPAPPGGPALGLPARADHARRADAGPACGPRS